jgi:hypothetical protein
MTLRKRKGPTPTWWTLLNEAVRIIDDERQNISDYDARRWIRKYDRFLKPARAELLKRHKP